MQRFNRIKVIGTGGIGLSLLPNLCRFVQYETTKFPSPEVHLVDGDTFEEKNRDRQKFTQYGPKATATANDIRNEFPRLKVYDHPVFVDEDNVVKFLREGDLVLSCVDNHQTRKILSDRAEELNNIIVISGANDVTHGDIITHIRMDGKNITSPVACKHHHPTIANPTDLHPKQMNQPGSCTRQAESKPQLVLMNNLVAANMLGMFYNCTDPVLMSERVLKNPAMYHQAYIDMTIMACVCRERKVM